MPTDRHLVRDLATRYAEVCADPAQAARRDAWRRHNSLQGDRPLIYVRAFAWHELPEHQCQCTDPFLRGWEDHFRQRLYWASLGDDSIFEPWVTVGARYRCSGWGVPISRQHSGAAGGAFKVDYPLRDEADIDQLRAPWHEVDEAATAAAVAPVEDLLGDILTVDVDRAGAYRMWTADLSTDLFYLRGIEHFCLDMLDRPEWLHRLVGFMADGVARCHQQAEDAGDWGLTAHQNQAMPYAEELPDPAPNERGVARGSLWGYMASQEFTSVSPGMWAEFLLAYQKPILERFGLSAYGCCEDLSRKIPHLRQIANLRRIAVSPFADVAQCAEAIGRDYVLSYRPSPADMVGYGWDEERVVAILRRDLTLCRESHVDITLKDVETVQGDSRRPAEFVRLCRQVIGELWG